MKITLLVKKDCLFFLFYQVADIDMRPFLHTSGALYLQGSHPLFSESLKWTVKGALKI